MHDARDTGAARPDTTTSPPAVPPLGSIHRGIWAHIWADRSPESKLSCTATDASRRLKGLGDVLLSIATCQTASKHDLEKFSFLAEAVNDIADALTAALEGVRQARRAAELVEDEARDREAKAAKRRRKALKRRARA
jgi:hypothetical protein